LQEHEIQSRLIGMAFALVDSVHDLD